MQTIGTERGRIAEGLGRGAGPAAATFVFGVSFGATAAAAGWGVAAPLTFSAAAFSGSAQSTVLSTLGAGLLPAVAAAALINVRYLVMGVALNGSLRGPRWVRALQAQALNDAGFAVAHRGGGRFDRWVLFGACVPQWLGWFGGTALGLVLAPDPELMTGLGLDVAFPAFFLLLAIQEMGASRRATAAAGLGAALATAGLAVLPAGLALLLASAAAFLGFRTTRGTA